MQKLNEMSKKLSFDAEGKVLNEFKISLLPPFTFLWETTTQPEIY